MIYPLVSIIVTVYNKRNYIVQALQSVINQTYHNLEVIVIDDGSTDGSLEMIQQVATTDHRVSVITQPNAGVATARNKGLLLSQGEFVNILDGDDLLYSRFVEQAVNYFQQYPNFDIVHTSWDRINDKGNKISTTIAPDSEDYLRDLLLGNMFAPSAVMFRKDLIDRIGSIREGLVPTEDWEYMIRCAKAGARFLCIKDVLAAYREVTNSARKIRGHQSNRFFPVIELVFDGTMAPEYRRLKDISIIRHHFFLMQDYLNWGMRKEAGEQFDITLSLLRNNKIVDINDIQYLIVFLPLFTLMQALRFGKIFMDTALLKQAIKVLALLLGRLLKITIESMANLSVKFVLRIIYFIPFNTKVKPTAVFKFAMRFSNNKDYTFNQSKTVVDIRNMSLNYLAKMRLVCNGKFIGYRYSKSTTMPVLYATIAALLLKHLYGVQNKQNNEEIEYVLQFQGDDGLFRDSVISCKAAEIEDWWGWRHLTLHALMTLALYNVPTRRKIHYIERYKDKSRFREYLNSRDWGARVAWTSNELQNIGVMLQYARDYQDSRISGELIDILYEVIDVHQDERTGLFGISFDTPQKLSLGVQAGYHFWLLYFYDRKPINSAERIIDSILKTQNKLGSYGVQWNSSACDDIDSIDLLVRFSRMIDYRREDIQDSLRLALPAVLCNLNGDGGWVFRRHEALTVGHRQMFSTANESNMFYTWFRTLGLAYCLSGIKEMPPRLYYGWNFKHVLGHQFI